MSGFYGPFATGMVCQWGNAYPSGHLVPSPFLRLACTQIVEKRFLEHVTRLFTLNTLRYLLDFALGMSSLSLLYISLILPIFINKVIIFNINENMIWKTHIIGNINIQKWYFIAFYNLKLTVISYFSLRKHLYKIYI